MKHEAVVDGKLADLAEKAGRLVAKAEKAARKEWHR